MQRSRLTRREVLGHGLRMLAAAGPAVLLAAACSPQQPAAPAKPAESKPAEAAKPAAPAAATAAPAAQAAPAQKPAEAAKPADAAKPAAAKPDTVSPAMAGPNETPKRGGTLRAVVQNDFVTMWPMITTGPTASVCYDALVAWRKGDDGRWGPKPGLAESWELSDKAAVFKLRKGVKFHDGSDLNADAVKYNVDLWMKHPKSIAKANLGAVNKENPAEVVDDYTVKINLTGAAGSLLSALSDGARETGIFSKAAHQKLGDDGMNLQAVGTGPFVWESFQSGSQFVANKNPNYWEKGLDGQALPYLDKIIYRFVPDDSVRFTELRSGSADIAQLLRGRDVPAMKADPNLNYYEDAQQGRLYRFFFNAQKPPFKDNLKLRQAIQYAVDRDAVAKAVGGGVGAANYYDLTDGTLGYDPSVPKYTFDLDKAKALLKESGVTTPLNVRITYITREADTQQAQILQQLLDKIGIKLELEGLERVAWGQKVRQNNDFEMATQQTSTPLDPNTLTQAWAPDGPAAYVRPNEPQIQDCLKEGLNTYDVAKRQATYAKCQTQMSETAWWGHMWIQPYNYLTNKKLKLTSPLFQEDWREWSMWFTS